MASSFEMKENFKLLYLRICWDQNCSARMALVSKCFPVIDLAGNQMNEKIKFGIDFNEVFSSVESNPARCLKKHVSKNYNPSCLKLSQTVQK